MEKGMVGNKSLGLVWKGRENLSLVPRGELRSLGTSGWKWGVGHW